ncbi:redoxin domain-containing protein [Zunongwangia endophytica]|uniref:Redoxin domain-containing protein n=1 Tax=Zunongwangia endophytica TaxID=1808945 RepID=A0ABV8HBI8_9FLAO|nr:redoxin domain-containing protein [Zunongwangia endophytica]MDN3593302.1 redoxin domain-containing protein [Zunongwangia endophytica]MDN3596922.1 redoxin domain-containing protein [Zunongwangia endophytica]
MKKLIALFCVILILIACRDDIKLKPGEYEISGKVRGMETGKLFLISKKPSGIQVDTLYVKSGNFNFRNSLENDVLEAYIADQPNYRSSNNKASIYIEPTRMQLQLNTSDFESVELTGSQTQEDAEALQQKQKELRLKYKNELGAYSANGERLKKAKNPEKKEELKWKDDELRGELQPYFEEEKELVKQFISTHPKSYISFENILYMIEEFTQEEARKVYNEFPESFKERKLGSVIKKQIDDKSKGIVGATAENFSKVDIDGKPLKLEDFKGQYVLLDFWASWCIPCRKGNPHLLKIYDNYNDKGFEIIGVSDDDRNPDAWLKAVKKDRIGVWRHILRGMEVDTTSGGFKIVNQGITEGYNISSLPTKILVDPDGKIVGRYDGSKADEEALDKKLADLYE